MTERDTAIETAPGRTRAATAPEGAEMATVPERARAAAAPEAADTAAGPRDHAPGTPDAEVATAAPGPAQAGAKPGGEAGDEADGDRPVVQPLPSRLRLWAEGVGMALAGLVLAVLYVPALRDRSQTIFEDVATNAMSPDHTGLTAWLRHGFFPFWSRATYGGEPYFANLQHGVLYPGNLPFLLFAPSTAMDVMIAVHLALASLGMWAYLRLALRTSMWAAVFGALCFTVGGVTLSHINLGDQFQVICLMPFMFLAGHFALERRRLRWVVATAVAIGMAFLAGHPEEWLYAMGMLAAYGGAWILFRERGGILRRLRQAVVTLGGAVVLFVLLFGWQLLPTLLLKDQGYRNSPTFNQQYPVPMASAVNVLLPDFGKVLVGENQAFVGTAALCLLGLAIAARRRNLLWIKVWMLASLLAGFVMALGNQNAVAAFLNRHSSLVREFRVPARYLVLVYFVLCVGAALGLDELLYSAVGRWRRRLRQGIFGVAVLAVGLGVAVLLADLRNDGLSWRKWLFAAGIGGLVWLAATFRRVPRPALAAVLILLTAAELYYARPYAEYRQKGPSELYDDYGPTLTALGADGGRYVTIAGRPSTAEQGAEIPMPATLGDNSTKRNYYLAGVFTRLAARPATNRAVNAATLLGRDGGLLPFREYRDFYLNALGAGGSINGGVTATPPSRWNWTALDFTAVEWFVTGDNLPASERAVLAEHGFRVAAHESYVLRWQRPEPSLARLVHQVDVIGDYDRRAAALAGYPFLDRAIVNEPVDLDPAPAGGGDSVETVRVANTSVELRTSSQARSLLVLADPYYPGWRVTVDGQPATVIRADHAFRGVVLPAGSHTVRFYYVDDRFRLGLGLAGLTILGLLAGTLLTLVVRRRRRRAADAQAPAGEGPPAAAGAPADARTAGTQPAGERPAEAPGGADPAEEP